MKFWLVFLMLLPLLILIGLIVRSLPLLDDGTARILGVIWKPRSGEFGFAPFIVSSLYVTIIALILAAPLCITSGIYLCFYAKKRALQFVQPVIDILAGIPSVVYGVWGVLAVVPFVQSLSRFFTGSTGTGYTILAGGITLSVMIIPYILNILLELFKALPVQLQEAGLSLGAGKWYTIKRILMKKAMPGIISAIGLGVSRAFGETMAVMMVVGNVAKIPHGIFQPGYPLPALIANNYGEMMSIPQYDAALMMAALLLLIIILIFNTGSRALIWHYEKNIG